MPRNYDHVLSFALEHPWALTRPMLAVVAGIIARRIAGRADPEAIEAAVVNRRNLPQPTVGSVGIIPVYGVLAPRLNAMSEMSGGTTFERLSAQLRECMASKAIKTIILDVDSPGGNAAGATEFANELLRARTKKPIIGQVQYSGCSAAYWLLACCTQVIAAPSAHIGSIGIYTSHDDLSAALQKEGVTRTFIAAGDGKVDANEAEPLSGVARARLQKMVDETYATMVGDIVKGRGQGLTAERVSGDWRALVYRAPEAQALGLIDSIATLEETVAKTLGASGEPIDLTALSTVPALDTAQEPARATAQDRTADAALERQLFELSL